MSGRNAAPKPVVLVVDDEAALRGLLAMALPRWNVDVLEAGNGVEAIELYKRHQNKIVLVLMDVNMPGATRPETLEILQQINPTVRCCFMTGNIGAYQSEDLLRRGAVCIIDKPFDLTELARIIQNQQIAA